MVSLQAGHTVGVDLLPQRCLKNLQQLAGIVVDKFRVALEAQHLVFNVVRRKRAELAGGDHGGVFRQGGDLVLVADQQRQLFHHRAHPRCLGVQFVVMDAHAPALGRPLGLATQQQRQQLVAEADADQLVAAGMAVQQVGLEGLDPRIGAKGVGLAARHQVRVEHFFIRRVFTLHHVIDDELGGNRLFGEQALEHLPVPLVLIDQPRTQDIGFQDAHA